MEIEVLFTDTEEQRIESWRMEALESAGFDTRSAAMLACRKDVDLHRAMWLVQHDCSPELALRILL
jgi:hypothetical protein